MGRPALRALFAIVVALGIAVAAPLHALAMPQPCAQMTEDASMELADEAAGQAGSGEPLGDMGGDLGAIGSMDCGQHCSALGDADPVFGSLRHSTEATPAGDTPPLILVFPELDPTPPRTGITA